MVQPHVGAQTAVLARREVPGAPQSDRAVVGARRQVLAAAAEVQAGDRAAVALWRERGQSGEEEAREAQRPTVLRATDALPRKGAG